MVINLKAELRIEIDLGAKAGPSVFRRFGFLPILKQKAIGLFAQVLWF